ncbi:MAG: hypothetical protein MUO68_06130, partial [Desulfobacteraceae bacterium]|nr:hypothetical protein [Desulfobacteraceae bacterium]
TTHFLQTWTCSWKKSRKKKKAPPQTEKTPQEPLVFFLTLQSRLGWVSFSENIPVKSQDLGLLFIH